MNSAEIGGIVRTIAAFGFGLLVSKGMIDGETATALAGAVATIGVAVWSVLTKKPAAE